MSRLLICSEVDLPSVNMRSCLIKKGGWEDLGSEGGISYMMKGNAAMMSISDMHIRHELPEEEAEKFGISVDVS